jgi:O-antigen ligase
MQAPRSRLFLPIAVVLSIWVLFGGAAPESLLSFGALALSGSAMLVCMLAMGGLASWGILSWTGRAMLLFFCLVPLVQLVPLPPSVWQALPGRALATDTLTVAEQAQIWHPISLSVGATFRSFLVSVWLVALLLALLQLSSTELRRIFGVLFALGIINAAIGIVQVVSGHTLLQLYSGLSSFYLSGLFANKNHTGLFVALTFLAGYAALYAEQGWNRGRLAMVVPIGLVLFVVLVATFSRAGMVFGLLAIGFLVMLSTNRRLEGRARYLAIAVPVFGLLLFLAVASTDLASRAFARFGGVDDDLRWLIWQWSWPLVEGNFPIGGGVGSFTSLFPPHEQLAWVKPTYVNHVHNDYIEQLIEIGILAPVAWLLILGALVPTIRMAWAERSRQSGRLALIGAAMLVLVALHSAVDYPLRRPAIMATCMVALASLLRLNSRGKSRLRHPAGYARQPERPS